MSPMTLAPVADPTDAVAGVASALAGYKESQSGYAILAEPVRHAILEIGDRMARLRDALVAVEPALPADQSAGGTFESLVTAALCDAVVPYLDLLGREIGFPSPAAWRAASRYFDDRFGALIDTSPVAARCRRKPLGYAGDFQMMNMIYRNEDLGETLFGRSLSRIVIASDAAQAVRNRVRYLAGHIRAAAARSKPGQPVRLLSVAAGPAMELQELLRADPALLRAGSAEIALLDQDASALSHARGQIEALAARAGVEVTVRCLNTSIRTAIADGLTGRYDLIYSAGLFDYLKDQTARAAGIRMVQALAPGGHALIGNFGPGNPNRPLMELVLDWPLIHRCAADLGRLFGDIGSGLTIEQEATGVNLFAMIRA